MQELFEQSATETIVLAQIEDPEAVQAALEIAETDGIDGVFIGPTDLSVAYGKNDTNSPELYAAFKSVGAAAQKAGKAFVSWAPTVEKAAEWRGFGVNMFFIASEHSWIIQGGRTSCQKIRAMD